MRVGLTLYLMRKLIPYSTAQTMPTFFLMDIKSSSREIPSPAFLILPSEGANKMSQRKFSVALTAWLFCNLEIYRQKESSVSNQES